MSSEAGNTNDEKVLMLEKKLAQCRLETDQLRNEKETWMIKKQLDEQLRDEIAANSQAASAFEEQKKSLKEELKAKLQNLAKVEKEFDEYHANRSREFSYKETEAVKASNKLKGMYANLKKRNERCQMYRVELDKLQSQIDKKWKDLIAFLQACRKNSKITDDVRPLLQDHYDAYITKLQYDDDDYRMLDKYVRVVLQPSSAQKHNDMFAGLDFISPVSTAISNVLNSSLFYNRSLTDRDPKGKHPVGERVDNESEHPKETSIGKKLWDFIKT